MSDFRGDPLRFLVETARAYGPVARIRLPRAEAYLVSQPNGIKRILQDNSDNYGRQTYSFQVLRATLGDGLLTTDGDFWRRQRRIAQPAFHKQRLAAFAGAMTEAADELVQRWRPLAGRGEILDVVPELLRLTLQILGRSLFGQDLSRAAATVGRSLTVVLRHTITTINSLFPMPEAVPTPANRRFKAALRELDAVVFETIQQRRHDGIHRNDLLSMLIETRDAETGEGMTDRQLRDEVMTLMLAGHETTAMALSWTLSLLSRHPSVRRTLEEELGRVLGGRAATLDDLPSLPYNRRVLEEGMRLYPPAWAVTRSVVADDEVDGFFIPAGSMAIVSPYVTHRDPSLWPNPEGFDPDRFAGDPPRYAYYPFGGGPHLCIGAGFAMMEAQIVLATLAQHFHLDLVPNHPLDPEPMVTLRPRHGIKMSLLPR
jgi:cytochrome P450